MFLCFNAHFSVGLCNDFRCHFRFPQVRHACSSAIHFLHGRNFANLKRNCETVKRASSEFDRDDGIADS